MMILVATAIHRDSAANLDVLLGQWSTWRRSNLSFLIVLNGALSVDTVRALRESCGRYSHLPLQVKVMANGYLDGWGALCAAQNYIRETALTRECTHVLMHEVSRVGPCDGLDRLLAYKVDVAAALYKDTWHPGFYCVYDFDKAKQCHVMRPYFDIHTLSEPCKVWGAGFGFTLIHRKVLEPVTFRSGKFAADTYFWMDLHDLGFEVHACPVFVENIKVDRIRSALKLWHTKRNEYSRLKPGEHWDHE